MSEYVKCPNGHQVPAGETECAQCRTLIQQEPLPLPSEPLLPRIPGYEILGELGRGGMGVVYKARHLALKRLVAVKTIRHLPLANADELHRFQREAEAVAAFQHPHIVQIHEIGAFEGMPYFTQELVEGGTLAAKLGGQPQPIMETAHLLQTLALAVDVAHQRGLVHRDLKPGNILLTADGQPKISDFGLAKRIDESGGATTSGAVVGTPSYMAPEQARGATHKQGIAAPADIYALGVILYEMLTGRPPFLGESVMDTVQQVLNEEPVSPRRLQPRVPRDLETICLKCLEKEPARRYAAAKALAEDLGRFAAGEPVNARPVGLAGRTWRWARRNRVVATLWGLLFLVFAGGLGGIIWNWRDARYQEKLANLKTDETKSANKKTELALEKMTKANQETKAALKKVTKANQETEVALKKVTKANQETAVALQRLQRTSYAQGVMLTDRELQANRVGQAEQFLAGCSEKYRDWEWHYLKRMCHNELLTLRGHAGPVTCVAWNEKSASRIASGGRDKTIRIWDGRTGREILKIADNDQAIAAVAFSPDGGQLVSASHVERGQRGHGQFILWNARTGTKIRELAEMTGTMPLAAFTPDGKLLATCSGILNSQEHAVKFWQVGTGQEAFRLSLGAPPSGLAFSADGRFLATGDSVGKLTVWDLATRKAVQQAALGKEGNIGLIVAFSPGGKQLAAAAGGAQLWLLDWEAPKQRVRLQGHAEDVHDLAFSPDGARLASASWDRTVKVWHTATGASAQTLRGHTEAVYSLAFNANGSRLVTAGEDATLKIWDLVDRPEERKLHDPGLIIRVAFNGDGTLLAAADTFGKVRLWDLTKGQEVFKWEERQNTIGDAAISSDGTLVAYATDTEANDGAIKICSIATRQVLRTLRGHKGPVHGVAFGPDGSVLASTGGDRCAVLWNVATGDPLHRYQHADGLGKVAFSPDGKLLAAATTGGTILWDTDTQQERFISGHAGAVNCVCFSPHGDMLASGGQDRSVRLWDLKNGKLVHVFPNHGDVVMGLSFHRLGRRLAVAAGNFRGAAEVKIYDLTGEGQEVLTVRRPQTVLDVAFSPKNDLLAAAWAAQESEISLWDGTPWNNAVK